MTNLIVDASIAVKWVIEQDNSEQARSLVRSPTALVAPSLILAEVGNALWKYVHHGQLSSARAGEDLEAVTAGIDKFIATKDLYMEALQLAAALDHPIYDCFYLALARQHNAPLVTADKRLLRLGDKIADVELQSL